MSFDGLQYPFILINSSMTHFVLIKHDETTYIKSPFLVAWIPVFRFIKLYEIPKLAVCVLLQPLKTHGISWSMPSNGETSPVAGSAWRCGHPLIFPGKDWHSWWVNQIYVELLKGYTKKNVISYNPQRIGTVKMTIWCNHLRLNEQNSKAENVIAQSGDIEQNHPTCNMFDYQQTWGYHQQKMQIFGTCMIIY